MTEFICDACGKKFKKKESLEYHTEKQVCNNKEIICKYCGNRFTTKNTMYKHIRNVCKVKNMNEYADKIIHDRFVEFEENHKKIEKKIKKLKREVKKNADVQIKGSSNYNNADNNINGDHNNNVVNINNNVVNNVVMVPFGMEDMSVFSKEEIIKTFNGYYTPVNLAELVHFNPKYPEYQNIRISNLHDQFASAFIDRAWKTVLKDDVVRKMYDNGKDFVDETFDEYSNRISTSKKEALVRFIEIDDRHEKVAEVRGKIILMIYNNRHMAKPTGNP